MVPKKLELGLFDLWSFMKIRRSLDQKKQNYLGPPFFVSIAPMIKNDIFIHGHNYHARRQNLTLLRVKGMTISSMMLQPSRPLKILFKRSCLRRAWGGVKCPGVRASTTLQWCQCLISTILASVS